MFNLEERTGPDGIGGGAALPVMANVNISDYLFTRLEHDGIVCISTRTRIL